MINLLATSAVLLASVVMAAEPIDNTSHLARIIDCPIINPSVVASHNIVSSSSSSSLNSRRRSHINIHILLLLNKWVDI